MTLVILGASSSAMASILNCTGGDKTLVVKTNESTRQIHSEAVLTTLEDKVVMVGMQSTNNPLLYNFTTANGDAATLKLTTPTKPGGGCKRCATTDDELFAGFFWGKLTYANQDLYFQCIPSN